MATQPVDARKVEKLLTSFERKLTRAEAQTIRRLARGLLDAQNRLLGQLQGPYNLTLGGSRELGRAVREARARALLQQVRGLLNVIPATARADLEDLVREGAMLGVESANALTTLYDPQLVASFSVVPQEAVLAAASNSYARLLVHGEEFAARASQSIVSGIATGSSWRKVATEIRQATGVTRREAERVVRTESVSAFEASNQAHREATGVRHYQWLSTLEFGKGARVCPYCASRHGQVWEEGKGPVPPAHPMCRCRTVPYKPEWARAGLTDDSWFTAKREEFKRHPPDGKPLKGGLTDFEKKAGAVYSPPFWTP
jgi:SPP1 gp7 family putative phage head morphogenesis protein